MTDLRVLTLSLLLASAALVATMEMDIRVDDDLDEYAVDAGCAAKGGSCTPMNECVLAGRDFYVNGMFCTNGLTCCVNNAAPAAPVAATGPMASGGTEDDNGTTVGNSTSTDNSTANATAAPVVIPTPGPTLAPLHATQDLLPHENDTIPSNINDYGTELQNNKAALQAAFKTCGVSTDEQVLFTAMAMLETNDMDLSERDTSKDGATDGSANVSIFNMSVDMVRRTGFSNPLILNQPGHLASAVCVLKKAVSMWGVYGTLNYVRGGYTGWKDGVSYGCADYRATIASIMHQIDLDPRLLTDDRRVEIFLGHV